MPTLVSLLRMETIMKVQALAMLPRLTDLHPGSLVPASRTGRRARPSLWQRIVNWNSVARDRRRLLELDARMLEDIGLTREDAYREATRPFWDIDTLR